MTIFKHKNASKEIPDESIEPATSEKVHELGASKLQELVEKNIKWSQVIYEQTKKTNHRLTIMAIGRYLRLLLILVPLIFALIYLPPYVKGLLNAYGSLLGGDGANGSLMDSLGTILKDYQSNNVSPDQIKTLLKDYQK